MDGLVLHTLQVVEGHKAGKYGSPLDNWNRIYIKILRVFLLLVIEQFSNGTCNDVMSLVSSLDTSVYSC